jgi:hypothetical protein
MGNFLTILVKSHFKQKINQKTAKFHLKSNNQTCLLCYKLTKKPIGYPHKMGPHTQIEKLGNFYMLFILKIYVVNKMSQKHIFTIIFGLFFLCSIFG